MSGLFDGLCNDDDYSLDIIFSAIVILCVAVLLLFLAVICMRYKYTKKIKMLQQQNLDAGVELRNRENLYVNENVMPSVDDPQTSGEETELTDNTTSEQAQQLQVNESANYTEIDLHKSRPEEVEKYCDISPLTEQVPAASSPLGTNDDDDNGIFGQFSSTSATESVEYSTPASEVVTAALLNKKPPPVSRRPRKSSMPPNYESIQERMLEVPQPDTINSASNTEETPDMGVVVKSKHKPLRRTDSRVDYDDVVIPSLPRSGSEVGRERRRIDLTSSQPVIQTGNHTVNANSTYSSLIHIELMNIHQRAAQENNNRAGTRDSAAVYSTLTGTPERFKQMPKECLP